MKQYSNIAEVVTLQTVPRMLNQAHAAYYKREHSFATLIIITNWNLNPNPIKYRKINNQPDMKRRMKICFKEISSLWLQSVCQQWIRGFFLRRWCEMRIITNKMKNAHKIKGMHIPDSKKTDIISFAWKPNATKACVVVNSLETLTAWSPRNYRSKSIAFLWLLFYNRVQFQIMKQK